MLLAGVGSRGCYRGECGVVAHVATVLLNCSLLVRTPEVVAGVEYRTIMYPRVYDGAQRELN